MQSFYECMHHRPRSVVQRYSQLNYSALFPSRALLQPRVFCCRAISPPNHIFPRIIAATRLLLPRNFAPEPYIAAHYCSHASSAAAQFRPRTIYCRALLQPRIFCCCAILPPSHIIVSLQPRISCCSAISPPNQIIVVLIAATHLLRTRHIADAPWLRTNWLSHLVIAAPYNTAIMGILRLSCDYKGFVFVLISRRGKPNLNAATHLLQRAPFFSRTLLSPRRCAAQRRTQQFFECLHHRPRSV